MKNKIVERTCMACSEKKAKQELLRIVKSKDGKIEPDLTGKKNGRGAYICKNEACLDKIIKSKRLNRLFEQNIDEELYNDLRGIIIDRQ